MTNYEKFQLQWMIDHNYSLSDLMKELKNYQYDDPDDSITELFKNWEQDRGFGSEIWPCEAEYEECEISLSHLRKEIKDDCSCN